ncbi:SDR family NAD(P)-dependent oxidoreductase [Cylindrospermopsis raciborskii]|jgi:3-oxoacyl-[acyl-carrier protein] reductase|uniref:SDR family NAD(P)-dependent oxidoreductase n=1 Tax=Cylindrospermopsis raciborskii TaxID=77022 RepID=UPI000E1F31D1|nr:SDR family oxidoreductase [Cylindrospermopsis raciborskii]UJL34045.1 SDR family oxidoreductase [Cylindrospermopsis raciborskii Cr2010]UJS05684.1 SDR family oxidoreductase [Cylindrospermopsis raciborskii KLL07]
MNSKVALITGASRGLGKVLAHRFWESNYSLYLIARSYEELQKVRSSLPPRPSQNCDIYGCDLSISESIERLRSEIYNNLSRLNVLINNAGTHGPIGQSWVNNTVDWQKTIQVNLFAPVALCQIAVPLMEQTGGGVIINLSGGGATGPRPNFSAYATAKAALVRFSETLAEETRGISIRVNCIAPGAMKTALLAEILEKGTQLSGEREFDLASKVLVEGGASMDRVADLALFLASEDSKGITGKLISAVWDRWEDWPLYLDELSKTDVYTLRRIVGRDRGMTWGDK